jgi:hypothetical protein
VNDNQPLEQRISHTISLWKTTLPIPVTLKSRSNSINFEIAEGSRGVTIEEFAITPAS